MQTKTYTELFALVQALCGVVFASVEAPRIKALINRRALRAYRSTNYWTRFLKIGEERAAVNSVIPYSGFKVISADAIEISGIVNPSEANGIYTLIPPNILAPNVFEKPGFRIKQGQFGDFPPLEPCWIISTANEFLNVTYFRTDFFPPSPAGLSWTPVSGTGDVTSLATTVQADLGAPLPSVDTFLRIYKQAPYVTTSAQEYEFTVTVDGASLISGDLNPAAAFVTYKAQLVDTYGDGVGEVSLVPAEWFQYIAHGTYSDYLRAEGQQEKSVIADQEAEMLLQDEMIRLDENHTSGLVSNRIFTNANMQLRY
jgi:hypothetical protein